MNTPRQNAAPAPTSPSKPATHHHRLAALAGLTVLLVACASPTPPPIEQMAVSRAALEHANAAGASEAAPVEMGMAREKMSQARIAFEANSNERALALAQQAQVDAQLAEAKAEAAKSRKTAAATAESNRVLREEMNRKTN